MQSKSIDNIQSEVVGVAGKEKKTNAQTTKSCPLTNWLFCRNYKLTTHSFAIDNER